MRLFTYVLLALLGLAAPVQAQGLSGTIHAPQWGATFTVPDGWVGRQSPQGYLFGSHTEYGIVALLPHAYDDVAALRTEAGKGLNDGLGTHLDVVEGSLKALGDHGVAAALTGTMGGQPEQAYLASVVSPSGGGVTVVSAVEPAYYTEALIQRTEQIAESVTFAAPQEAASQPAAPQGAPADGGWADRLAGSRLTYLYSQYSGGAGGSYAGASERTVIDLCSAGHFFYSGSHTLAVDGGAGGAHGGGRSQGRGRWTVIKQGGQPTLQLAFQSGEVATYRISYPGEALHLNGERFFWTTARSPAEYRPQCP